MLIAVLISGKLKDKTPSESTNESHSETTEAISITEEIQKAYFEKYDNLYAKYSYDMIDVVFYGSFEEDSVYVVMIYPQNVMYPSVISSEEVNGVVFTYNDSNMLTVYYNGDFYKLSDAYAEGILTESHLSEIAAAYPHLTIGKLVDVGIL